jgi:hypothetical protein
MISLPWGLVIKFIPLKFFQCISIDDKVEEIDEKGEIKNKLEGSIVAVFKKSATLKKKTSGGPKK